jgi:hypothetical protein
MRNETSNNIVRVHYSYKTRNNETWEIRAYIIYDKKHEN